MLTKHILPSFPPFLPPSLSLSFHLTATYLELPQTESPPLLLLLLLLLLHHLFNLPRALSSHYFAIIPLPCLPFHHLLICLRQRLGTEGGRLGPRHTLIGNAGAKSPKAVFIPRLEQGLNPSLHLALDLREGGREGGREGEL